MTIADTLFRTHAGALAATFNNFAAAHRKAAALHAAIGNHEWGDVHAEFAAAHEMAAKLTAAAFADVETP